MGGAAARDDVGPDESLVGEDEVAVARLRDQAPIGPVATDEVRGSDALVLLVGHEGEEDPAPDGVARDRGGGGHAGGDAGLHVDRAAAVELSGLDARLEGRIVMPAVPTVSRCS